MKRIVILFIFAISLVGLLVAASPATAADCIFYSEEIGYVCDARIARPRFEQPEAVADSLLDRFTYAWIADFANVYPQPGASAPSGNMGDGFLYVTIYSVEEVNGETWYQINPGEFIHADDVTVVETSSFAGMEINGQPPRPFGWFVQEVRPSSAPNTEPNPDFVKMERYDFFQIFDAVAADDGWLWYNIGDGRWIRQTYVSIVDLSPRPEGVRSNEYWVEIDLYEQTFAAYEGEQMVYAGLVSSGLNRWPTHEGLFQVWSRHLYTPMSGAEGKIDYYFIEDVPHTMFFDDDIALHGAYWHDRFGYKHSHGCVNMPPRTAEWVYEWSARAPNDLHVWVHTSDPNHYFNKYD